MKIVQDNNGNDNYENYPLIKVPDYFFTVKNLLPTMEESKPEPPIKPTKNIPDKPIPPRQSTNEGCSKSVIFFGVVGIIIFASSISNLQNHDSSTSTLGVLFGGFLICIFGYYIIHFFKQDSYYTNQYNQNLKKYYNDINRYPEKVRKATLAYDNDLKTFELKMTAYKNAFAEHNKKQEKILELENIINYRQNKLHQFLKGSTIPIKKSDDVKVIRGVCENRFFNFLNSKVPCFHQDMILTFKNQEKGFYPDIALIIPDDFIFIDIEIDEPYIGSTGEPIHYVESTDEARDKYFLENGWIILRFAEKQVLDSEKNIFTLINWILIILYENFELSAKEALEKLYFHRDRLFKPVKRWTKNEAHKMAFTRYRNAYLGFDFSEKLNTETLDIN